MEKEKWVKDRFAENTFIKSTYAEDNYAEDKSAKDKSAIEGSILNTAFQLLQDRKYRRTSVTSLSRQAGVSRSSFYRCFRNKEDVLCRLLQRELASPSTCKRETDHDLQTWFHTLRDHDDELLRWFHTFHSHGDQLPGWFHTLLSHDVVLELYYRNGYSELARKQVIALFAGEAGNTAPDYKKIFEAGGILTLYELWKKESFSI